ncbi:S-layer homology domain-containing protein [Sporosarcina psychrophila]|uniref:SLH domain-containing protein n=1 Tax=Sporosarcina psychrophila TaxID=1476 RepID=A0ABV2K5Q7_SPOPS
MANQPSKYSKFLVGAASAALVASAVAPVASAADFKDTKGNTHEEAINALSDSGVIKGYSDGTFLPNKTLTRSDVVKMMGKWLVTEGATIPADARTNPRFTDLTTKTNAELLDYAAVVKDAGVFIGSNGKLLATDNITRENMALVLVRAFDKVEDIDLVAYVNAQEFTKDVKDLSSAKKEAQAAINVLDFFDITNPTVASFNPKGNTTRGHFATFLHKTINADFSLVSGVVTGAVKAINATTVEVTFKEKVENVSDFTIEGLTVSNAAVKQTDDKVVVLTTSVQEGGKKYTVSHAGKEIGSFEGLSAVIPTKIDITTQSVQGKVGAQAVLSANVGVKQAGIPVTFNVKADTNTTLNKDQVFEAVTNADGIATFSYTQYAAGTDSVVAYPTGAPAVRSLGYVFWGVDTIVAVEEVTKGATINNGSNKTYKVTYKDPTTGKPVANKNLNVSFLENINVTADKLQNVTVNGVAVKQLTNDTAPEAAQITTDSKGEATFTVSGTNTAEVTPVVFEANNTLVNSSLVIDYKYDASDLQASAAKVKFSALQADYTIDVTRDGNEAAAIGHENGREYNVVVKDKDGKLAANEVVNVAFNEDLDRVISTNTTSYFVETDANGNRVYTPNLKQVTVTTNAKGEASFVIANDAASTYATPVAWIDINSAYVNKQGNLDEGEPKTVAAISYFEVEKLEGASLKVKDANGKYKATADLKGNVAAEFKVELVNQSGEATDIGTLGEVTYTIHNTGSSVIYIGEAGLTTVVSDTDKISPNRSKTVKLSAGTLLKVSSYDGKTGSVKVVATGKATHAGKDFNFVAKETTAKFTAVDEVTNLEKGNIKSFDTSKKTLTIADKKAIKYTGETGKTYTYRDEDNRPVSLVNFEKALLTAATLGGNNGLEVTYEVKGDNVTFYLKTVVADAPINTIEADKDAAEQALAAAKDALDKAIKAVTVTDYEDDAAATALVDAAKLVLAKTDATKADFEKATAALAEGLAKLDKKPVAAVAPTATVAVDGNNVTLTFTSNVNVVAGQKVTIDAVEGTVAAVTNKKDVVVSFATAPTTSGAGTINVTVDATSTTKEGKFTYELAFNSAATNQWTVGSGIVTP